MAGTVRIIPVRAYPQLKMKGTALPCEDFRITAMAGESAEIKIGALMISFFYMAIPVLIIF